MSAFEREAAGLVDQVLAVLPQLASQASLVRQQLRTPEADWTHEADVLLGWIDSLAQLADALDDVIEDLHADPAANPEESQ